MKASFQVTIYVGPRTATRVDVTPRSVNEKQLIKLRSGGTVTDTAIANWIAENLLSAIERLERS